MYRGQAKTAYFWVSVILPLLLLLTTVCWVVLRWDALPDAIPLHYDIHGRPEDWGNKAMIWVMPATGLGIYVLLLVSSFFPQTWKIRGEAARANPTLAYAAMAGLIADFRIGATALLCLLTVWGGLSDPGPGWVITAAPLIFLFIPLTRYILRLYVLKR